MRGRLGSGGWIAAAAAILAAFGCGGMQMSLGRPQPSTVFVIKQPEGQKWHYLVHVNNANPDMDDPRKRHRKVRESLVGHCKPEKLVDLYAHPVGSREQGDGPLLSYTVGVLCEGWGQAENGR